MAVVAVKSAPKKWGDIKKEKESSTEGEKE